MRREVLTELDKNPDLYMFLREYPIWYRTLNRDPYSYKEFIEFYKVKTDALRHPFFYMLLINQA